MNLQTHNAQYFTKKTYMLLWLKTILLLAVVSMFSFTDSTQHSTRQRTGAETPLNKKPAESFKEPVKKYTYTLVWKDYYDRGKFTLTLLGKFPLNTPVSIIDNKTGKLFKCKTKGYKTPLYECETISTEKVLTTLDVQPAGISTEDEDTEFLTAIIGEQPSSYAGLDIIEVTDPKVKADLGLIIKNVLPEALAGKHISANDYKTIGKTPPRMYKIEIPGIDCYFARYTVDYSGLLNVLDCVVIGNEAFRASSRDARNNFYAYQLDDQYFLRLGAGTDYIYELNKDGVTLLYEGYFPCLAY